MRSLPCRIALFCAAGSLLVACAGVKEKPGSTSGMGGSGGTPFGIGGSGLTGPISMIPGLTGITVSPKESTVVLTGTGTTLTGSVTLTATGVVNGTSMDISSKVLWTTNLPGASPNGGNVTFTAPGVYTITAANGEYKDSATITVTFTGDVVGDGVSGTAKSSLDRTPGGTAATLAYPLDHTVFPANLTPIYVQVSGGSSATAARLRFEADGVAINYYGKCETGMPGGACNVKLPPALTRLLVATSDRQDVKLTARVGGSGAPRETSSVGV